MKKITTTLVLLLCGGMLPAQQNATVLYVGHGASVKIGSSDTLMIKGGLVNANRNEYLTIHNAGHIMLTGDLEDPVRTRFYLVRPILAGSTCVTKREKQWKR